MDWPLWRGYIALAARKSHLLVRDYERMTLCGKARGIIMIYIPSGGPTAKNPWSLRPIEFCLPRDFPWGYIHHYSPWLLCTMYHRIVDNNRIHQYNLTNLFLDQPMTLPWTGKGWGLFYKLSYFYINSALNCSIDSHCKNTQ